jgi:hypothetical protein
MPKLNGQDGFKSSLFSFRFILISLLNFTFGYSAFAVLWLLGNSFFTYWQIACLSTLFSSIFSFQSQSRFVLRKKGSLVLVQPSYIFLQFFSLVINIVVVPFLSDFYKINILLAQFFWSSFFSVCIFFTLFLNKK